MKTYWVGGNSYTFPDDTPDDQVVSFLRSHTAGAAQSSQPAKQDFNAAHRSTVGKPYGDTPDDMTATEGGAAAGKGVLAGLGINIPNDWKEGAMETAGALYPPLGAANQTIGMVKGALQSVRDAKAAESPQGAVSKLAGVIPVVGQPLSDLSQPAVAVSEGRAPSKAENLGALKGGAELATLAVAPKVLARFHGKGKLAQAPAETPPAAQSAAEPAAEPVIGDEGPRLSGGSEVSGMTKTLPPDAAPDELTQLRQENEILRKKALESDVVEGMPNRRAWQEMPRKAALAGVDIDNLKPVNDTYGHGAGDSLINATGQALREAVAEIGGDVAHKSGDEFMAQHDDMAALTSALEKARQTVIDRGVEYEGPDGQVVRLPPEMVKGFSYGTGTSEAAVEPALRASKDAREAAGFRRRREDIQPAGQPQSSMGTERGGLPPESGSETGGQVPPRPEESSVNDADEFHRFLNELPTAEGAKGVGAEPLTDEEAIALGLGPSEPAPEHSGTGREPKVVNAVPPFTPRTPEPPSRGPGHLGPSEPPPSPQPGRSGRLQAAADFYARPENEALYSYGQEGKQLTHDLNRVDYEPRMAAAKWENTAKEIAKGLTDEQVKLVTDLKEGKIAPDDPRVTPAMQEAAAKLEAITNARYDEATNAGVPVPFREKYAPHYFERSRTADPNAPQPTYRNPNMESGSLRRSQTTTEGYEKDFRKWLPRYMAETERDLQSTKHFGGADAASILPNIETRAQKIADAGYNGQLAKKMALDRLGAHEPDATPARVAADVANAVAVVPNTALVPIKHISKYANFFTQNGVRGIGEAAKALFTKDPAAKAEADILSKAAANYIDRDLYESGGNSTLYDKMSKLPWLKAARLADAGARVVNALGAGPKVRETLAIARGEIPNRYALAKVSPTLAAKLQQEAADTARYRYGVSPESMKSGTMTPEETRYAKLMATNDAQFPADRGGTPLASHSPVGRVTYALKKYAIQQGSQFNRNVVQPAKYGNLVPLARFLVSGAAVGAVTTPILDYASRHPDAVLNHFGVPGRPQGEQSWDDWAKSALAVGILHGIGGPYTLVAKPLADMAQGVGIIPGADTKREKQFARQKAYEAFEPPVASMARKVTTANTPGQAMRASQLTNILRKTFDIH